MITILKKGAFAIAGLAAFIPLSAKADVVETYIPGGGAYNIPTIVVDGNRNGYNKILTENLTFNIRVKAREPENKVSLSETKLRVENTIRTFSIGDNIYSITMPVMSLRTQNGRVSPIKLCNDELNRNQGTERDTLIASGSRLTRYSAYWVGASARWLMTDGRKIGFSDVFSRTWHAKSLYIPVNVECKSLGPAPATNPYKVEVQVTPKGNACPNKVEVRAFIRYRGPATAKFRFKVDGKLSELHEIKAREISQNQGADNYEFLVERIKNYTLGAGQHRIRVEVRGGDKSKVKTININCPKFRVSSTDLKYNMVNNGKCPRQVWETTTFQTNGPGKFPFKIKHSGGLVIHHGTAEAKLFDDKYKAVVQRVLQMSETDMQLNAIPGGFETAQSGWKNLKIECEVKNNGASASGELSAGASEPPDVRPSKKITGDFQFLDNSGKTQCPRQVRGVINFQLNRTENVHYSLDCNSGSHPSGVIQPTESSNGKFIAPAIVSVTVPKPDGANGESKLICALKAREGTQMILKKLKGRDFSCIKRNPNAGTAVSGLSSGANTQTSGTQEPKPPKKKATVCKGGKLRAGKCYCPKNAKRKKISGFEYVCKSTNKVKPTRKNPDKSKTTPVRTNPDKPKKTKIICQGGKARKGKCSCGPQKTPKKLAKHKFKCVAKSKRTNPVKPKKKDAARTNPKPKKKVKLICKGGKIKGGRCKCGKNRKLKKTGRAKFICYMPQQ